MFDELLAHLKRFKSPAVISILEDATRIISHEEYHSHSTQCVGFVLSSKEDGLLFTGAYEATSFDSITEMFKRRPLSKFAYTLYDDVPAFCMACIDSDNRFDYKAIFAGNIFLVNLKKKH